MCDSLRNCGREQRDALKKPDREIHGSLSQLMAVALQEKLDRSSTSNDSESAWFSVGIVEGNPIL